MKHILLAATLLATPAMAQETQPVPKLKLDCMPLTTFKIKNEKAGGTATVMTPGQFNFLAGLYVGSSATPAGLPPGDGAIIVSGGEHIFVVWTHGKLACNPLPIDAELLVIMAKLTGGDDGGDDADTH